MTSTLKFNDLLFVSVVKSNDFIQRVFFNHRRDAALHLRFILTWSNVVGSVTGSIREQSFVNGNLINWIVISWNFWEDVSGRFLFVYYLRYLSIFCSICHPTNFVLLIVRWSVLRLSIIRDIQLICVCIKRRFEFKSWWLNLNFIRLSFLRTFILWQIAWGGLSVFCRLFFENDFFNIILDPHLMKLILNFLIFLIAHPIDDLWWWRRRSAFKLYTKLTRFSLGVQRHTNGFAILYGDRSISSFDFWVVVFVLISV